jgi:voltage-gated potassium channel
VPIRLRQATLLITVITLTCVAGTVGFRVILAESWFQSFYRTVVTVTLAGLDTVPANSAARALSIVLLLAGLTIIAYAGAVIVETMTGGVLSGALVDRRRRQTIDQLHDHYIICGYGRVGRRVAEDSRHAGVS